MLGVVTVLALIGSAWNSYRLAEVNRALRVENRRLRDEVGELTIDDPEQVQLVQVPRSDHEWMFRVWIPEGRPYQARVADEVPAEGFPADGGMIGLQPGEQVLRYVVERDQDGKWFGKMTCANGTVGRYDAPWVEWPSHVAMTSGVGRSTVSVPPGKTIEVCRFRVSQASSSANIENPSAGFMLWLTP